MSQIQSRPMPPMQERCPECRRLGGHLRTCRTGQRNAPAPAQRASMPARAPLRRLGEGKRAWTALYVPWLAFLIAIDPYCRRCRWLIANGKTMRFPGGGMNKATEGHHPFGQLGALILVVLPICRECHDDIHFKNPKQARDEGWIRDLE